MIIFFSIKFNFCFISSDPRRGYVRASKGEEEVGRDIFCAAKYIYNSPHCWISTTIINRNIRSGSLLIAIIESSISRKFIIDIFFSCQWIIIWLRMLAFCVCLRKIGKVEGRVNIWKSVRLKLSWGMR